MGQPSLFPAADNARLPMLISDGNGALLWCNSSLTAAFPESSKARQLSEFLPEQLAKRIMTTEGVRLFESDLAQNTAEQASSAHRAPWSIAVIPISAATDLNPVSVVVLCDRKNLAIVLSELEDSLASISHDLKNPLGAIFGYADAMLDTAIGTGMNEKQRDIIARIRSTASRTIELVRNFQHLAQLSAQTEAHARVSTSLNTAISAVVAYTWREDPLHPILETDLASGEVSVQLDRVLLERVLTNLYSNALKFTPREGKIKISSWVESGRAFCSIQNNLPLIPEEELSRVFDRYARGANSKGIAGSGLGLYIVRQILNKAGGDITAQSSAATGTIFTFYLPVARG